MSIANRKSLLPWLLCLFCLASASVNTAVSLAALDQRPALFEVVEVLGWGWALPALFSLLAALIIARQPGNRVGWLLLLPALVMAMPVDRYLSTPKDTLTPALWLLLWFDGWSWIPAIFPVFLIPLHFPTGLPPSPRWNWVNRLAISMWLFFVLALPLMSVEVGPANYDWRLPNPLGLIPLDFEGPIFLVWGIGLITVVATSVASLFVRYRAARAVERQQIKWLLYAGATFVLVYAFAFLLSPIEDDLPGVVNLLFVISILAIGAAIAIAILRYRLYDIDVIIRKTLQYAVLSAVLALVYFGSVILLQTVFEALTGERSPAIIVLSTLLIAALFAPLRRRIQAAIDRRFFRKKYDAQQVLAQFAAAARNEVSLDTLAAELLRVVRETVQPDGSTIWLSNVEARRQVTQWERFRETS